MTNELIWSGRDPKLLEFLRHRALKGKPTPTIDNWPELFEHLEFYYQEFLRLSARRASGFNGGLPIAGEEIDRRIRYWELVGHAARQFSDHMEFLDVVYLNFSAERSKEGEPKPEDG